MSAKRAWACAGRLISVLVGASCLTAADYSGVVTASGLPVPGVTVTATQEGRKLITTTDERGAFQFPGLSDGAWAITLEMVGFARLSREVRIERNATASQWELKFPSAETPATGGAAAPRARAAPGARFQRLEVSQSAATNVFSESDTIRTEEAADLTQSAADSFLVQGSMSSALGLERQNDCKRLSNPSVHASESVLQ